MLLVENRMLMLITSRGTVHALGWWFSLCYGD